MNPEVYAAAAVTDALDWAEKQAAKLWSSLSDSLEKALYPGKHRFKERNAKYKASMGSLLKSAQAAAKAGDYVTATALARTAQFLSSRAPYKDWSQIEGAEAQLVSQAAQMSAAYAGKAGLQMAQGIGGTFRAGGNTGLLLAAAAVGALLLLRGRR